MTIGKRIENLRKSRDVSQMQLASLMGVSRQAVSKWENDLTAPDTIRLIQLADLLDTDVEYLATGNHAVRKAEPQIVTVEKIVEKPVVVEKIVEIEKLVEVEKIVNHYIEKPVIRKVRRTQYIRNPAEYGLAAFCGLVIGLLIGILL